jgi:hypothetical protein
MQVYFVGIVAGIAAALMYLAPIGGTPLAFPLFLLTGLPIGIAGLGWGPVAGASAVVAGAAAILAVGSSIGAACFALLFAIPVAWASYLALKSELLGKYEPTRQWFPVGAILLNIAAAAAIGVILTGLIIGFDREALTNEVTAALLNWFSGSANAPTAEELQPFVRFNMAILPFTVAAILVCVLAFGLWLASVVTRMSGRLARPPSRLGWTTLPQHAWLLLAFTAALSFLPGPTGELARVGAGAFTGAAALTGLAVLHTVTLGMSGRTAILVVAYAVLILSGLPIFLFALLAIADAWFQIRARRSAGMPPPA